MSGKFYNFPVCFREAAFVCFMSSDSHWVRVRSLLRLRHHQLLTSHEPSRGAGEWRKLFVKFSEYFLPVFCFLRSVGRLLAGLEVVICEISLSRQTDNDRLARLPSPPHHYHTLNWNMGAGRVKLSSEKIISALSAFLVRAWNILTVLWGKWDETRC